MDRLRQDYLHAFQDYVETARRLQSLTTQSNPEQAAIDAVLLQLEKARLTYNACRDALASGLLQPSLVPSSRVSLSRTNTDRVRSVAALRWEVAGRPEGTAEEDWFRAEEIVSSAA
jgi:hypothetical protein